MNTHTFDLPPSLFSLLDPFPPIHAFKTSRAQCGVQKLFLFPVSGPLWGQWEDLPGLLNASCDMIHAPPSFLPTILSAWTIFIPGRTDAGPETDHFSRDFNIYTWQMYILLSYFKNLYFSLIPWNYFFIFCIGFLVILWWKVWKGNRYKERRVPAFRNKGLI